MTAKPSTPATSFVTSTFTVIQCKNKDTRQSKDPAWANGRDSRIGITSCPPKARSRFSVTTLTRCTIPVTRVDRWKWFGTLPHLVGGNDPETAASQNRHFMSKSTSRQADGLVRLGRDPQSLPKTTRATHKNVASVYMWCFLQNLPRFHAC